MRILALAMAAVFAATSVRALDVTGAVYDEQGNAVANARVEARVPVTHAPLAQTTTSADGEFVLHGLDAGVVEIAAGDHAQYVLAGDSVTVNLLTSPRRMRTKTGKSSVHGVVLLDGKRLAHAPVTFSTLDHDELVDAETVTDAKGEFRISDLAAATYSVGLDPRLEERLRGNGFFVDLSKTADAEANLSLTSAPAIRGRVVDADGKAVARTIVKLVLATATWPDLRPAPRTDPSGRYTLFAPKGIDAAMLLSVAVVLPLHSVVHSKPFSAEAANRTVDITLPRFDKVTMRVSDREGHPIPNADVGFVASPASLVPPALGAFAQHTDDAGTIVFHLIPNTYDFSAVAPHFQRRSWRAAAAPTLDVRLERAALLRGWVHRGERGVADVNVAIPPLAVGTATESDGRFEIDGLAPGTYRLFFMNDDEWIDQSLAVDAPGEVDLALPPTGTLRVRALGANGIPIHPYSLSILLEGQGAPTEKPCEAADGTVSLTIPVGAVRLRVTAEDYLPTDADAVVPPGKTTALDVHPRSGATITGRVLDERGNGVSEAFLQILSDEGNDGLDVPQTLSLSDGAFRIGGIPQGRMQLRASADGYVNFVKAFDLRGPMTLAVLLSRGLVLHGVVMRNGKPVPQAYVILSGPDAAGDQQTASDSDGRFTFTGLSATRYQVQASREGSSATARSVDPATQQELILSLDDKEHGVVYGSVIGYEATDGERKFDRRAVSAQGDGTYAETKIDEAGNYRIENAPLGAVQVTAVLADSAGRELSETREVEVRSGEPQRVDLHILGAIHVRGLVTSGSKPVAGAHVTVNGDDGRGMVKDTSADGTFELQLWREGMYLITASDDLATIVFRANRELRDGDRLDIDLGAQQIEGTVVDAATREPVRDAGVRVAAEDDATIATGEEAYTDAVGHFTVLAPASTPARAIAWARGYAPSAIRIDANTKSVAFELARTNELRVRVFDARSGVPLEALLTLVERDGTPALARPEVAADGRTTRFDVAEGKYRLRVSVDGYAMRVLDVTAPSVVDVPMQ